MGKQAQAGIEKMAQTELWGKIPDKSLLPAVKWVVGARTSGGTGLAAYYQFAITGYIDSSRYPAVRNVPRITATLRIPQGVTGLVPIMIALTGTAVSTTHWNACYPYKWGVCAYNYAGVQPDNAPGLTSYLIGLVNQGHYRKPDDWGVLAAWSWGVSRLIDLFETYKYEDKFVVDAKKIGVTGHSRWGKGALITMAYEPRIAIGFPSCSGALGVVQSQRHWGEELELVAGSGEYYWCAGNILKYCGELTPGTYKPRKVENLKVDGQSLLSLCAPRPVFLNGGKPGDSWQDPYGAFLSAQLASPVWELYGYQGVVMNDKDTINRYVPLFDTSYHDGRIAYRLHSVGGHADTPDDWAAFMRFSSRYIQYVEGALPVLFKSFTAERNSSNVSLKWVTASEQNSSGFYIQSTQDGNWKTIGFMPSKAAGGNSSFDISYEFTDPGSSKLLTQYRIRQVNLDQTAKFSDVRIIRAEGQPAKIVVFPNPSTNGKINVLFDNLSAKEVQISDLSGKIIRDYKNVTGNTEINGLTTGMYSIRVIDKESKISSVYKVVVK